MSREGLLRVENPPLWQKEGESGEASGVTVWMAHEECANVVPETWIDEVDVGPLRPDGTRVQERVVLGVDGIVKDRWNLVSLIRSVCCDGYVLMGNCRNAMRVRRRDTSRTVPLSSAPRVDVRRPSTSPVLVTV